MTSETRHKTEERNHFQLDLIIGLYRDFLSIHTSVCKVNKKLYFSPSKWIDKKLALKKLLLSKRKQIKKNKYNRIVYWKMIGIFWGRLNANFGTTESASETLTYTLAESIDRHSLARSHPVLFRGALCRLMSFFERHYVSSREQWPHLVYDMLKPNYGLPFNDFIFVPEYFWNVSYHLSMAFSNSRSNTRIQRWPITQI